ncbi:MAG TPA: NusA-like transcription termination signal-binding factor [Nitrososphaerales archaeon]|jgi:N utilization substance protein A|nr:NusA-like transcription termination signal-binding factor [Nitrososphaerales archaeon]|tara:strand:+ start:7846 stop:8292 length:447 start_codon:yes stop_codon:yes gene_type:complete
MPEIIKLTSDELGLISLFQNITGATARDCVIDDKLDRVIFIINKGEMGLAIGKNGASILKTQKMVGKEVELVEYSEDPKIFIINALNSKFITDIRLSKKVDGSTIAVITVNHNRKGVIVGRNGKNAEKARLLARRYFQISNIHIVTKT